MGVTGTAERAARARAALAAAEARTGARPVLVPGRAGGARAAGTVRAAEAVLGDDPSGRGAGQAPDAGRAPVTGRTAERRPPRTSLLTSERPPLPVPPGTERLLPDGLRRGATTSVLGSTALTLTLLAHACAGGDWAVAVGLPDLGLLAAARCGVVLDRFALVPQPGPDALTVLGALLDGVGVVLVGPGAVLADADRRRLTARARERGAVLLTTVPWPGAATVLTVQQARWTGLGAGDGRLRTRELRVRRTGRGPSATPLVADVVLPLAAPGDGAPSGPGRGTAPARRTGRPDTLRLVG